MREAMKDKGYQSRTGLGPDIAVYLRARRKSLAENSLLAYESTLNAMAWHFADLMLPDFEPPVGTVRLEEFLDAKWGTGAPASYNRHLAVVRDFFQFTVMREAMEQTPRLRADPTLVIQKAKKREVFRTTFSTDQARRIVAEQDVLRDKIALRLLLHYGLRRSGLRAVQFKHFDHVRKRLTVFLKGGRVRQLPIPEPAFWHDLERHILDCTGQPNHYLMAAGWGNRYQSRANPENPMSPHALHKWWYRCLAKAGIVSEGTSSGERMHKARHTAGQTVLDKTGNLKAVQNLLMHTSIQTTGDIYTDWDVDALAQTLGDVYGDE